jgi:TRAP-type C4-dicarboxylate transport system permease small subunit
MSWRLWLTGALRRLCHFVAAVATLVMVAVTFVNVVARTVFNHPFVGVTDAVAISVMWATMMGIALAWSQRAHIVVDLLDMTGLPRLTQALDVLTRVAGIVIMPLLVWLAYDQFKDTVDFGDRTPELQVLIGWWYWLPVLIGFSLSALFLLIEPPAEREARDA